VLLISIILVVVIVVFMLIVIQSDGFANGTVRIPRGLRRVVSEYGGLTGWKLLL